MTKHAVLEKVQTILIVTVIAVLVWLFADVRNIKTYPREALYVKFVAQSGNLAIDPRSQVPVAVTVKASTESMTLFKEWRKDHGYTVEIEVAEPPDSEPGKPQTILLKDELAQTDLAKLGLVIVETDPPTLAVVVERLDTILLPVDFDFSKVDVQFINCNSDPTTVEVTLPVSMLPLIPGMSLTPRLDRIDFDSYVENESNTAEVHLQLPEELESNWTTMAQTRVQVTFAIRKVNDTYTHPGIPIQISAPPIVHDRYSYELSDQQMMLTGVTLKGPAELIEAIKNGEKEIRAVILLKAELEPGIYRFTPFIVAPQGVQSDPPEVEVTITPRSANVRALTSP